MIAADLSESCELLEARSFNSEKMQWLNGVSQDGKISPTAFRIAYRISDYLNRVSGYAWPAYDTLARQVSLSTKSVQRAVAELKKAGWLKVQGSYKQSNNYRIAWPPGYVRKSRVTKKAGDKSALGSGRNCPEAGDADVPQSYLRNLPRTNLRRPGEVSRTGKPFADRGRWEQQIIERFGSAAQEVLEDLQRFNPLALDEMCRDQRDGRLTQGMFDSRGLGIAEIKSRRRM